MPKPVLQAMVLADHVYRDAFTGKYIIAGTFTRLCFGTNVVRTQKSDEGAERRVITGPISRIGSPYLYLALVEVCGQVPLELKFIDLSDSGVLFEAQLVVSSSDPIAVAEYVLAIPELPTRKEGSYSLDILYDNEILGSWRLSVVRIETQEPEGGGEQ